MSELNTNVDEYSIDELLHVLNLEPNPSLRQIHFHTEQAINRVKESDNYDEHIISFLDEARNKLISTFSNEVNKLNNQINNNNNNDNDNSDKQAYKQADKWYQNQYLKQSDPTQYSKLTDRVQQVEIFNDNTHYPMKKNYLGVNQSIQLPVSQDSLNPTLRNLNTRIINIDSQFRSSILPFNPVDPNSSSSPTNYTFELSDSLTNVLSMLLYSVQIPNTWYRFSLDQGNTCFNVEIDEVSYSFNLPQGNYDPSGMLIQLDTDSNWASSLKPPGLSWNYNYYSSKFMITLVGSNPATFYFYDISGGINCNGKTCFNNSLLNQNLGWSLGFRPDPLSSNSCSKIYTSFTKTYAGGNTYSLDAVSDLYGPKYFSIILDDFNQNRQNKGLVNIGVPEDGRLSLPNYFFSNEKVKGGINVNKITNAQVYSINQILSSKNTIKQRNYGTNSSDVLAILPIDMNSNIRQQPYTSFGANLLLNERRYYGPVDINKMKVRLVDDKGNTVNLNGADWCMSIIINELYQY